MCGGELEIDRAVLVLHPLDMAYLCSSNPVWEEAQIDMVVDLIPDDLVRARVGEVARCSRCPLKCFRFREGPGTDLLAVRTHQRCNHAHFIRIGENPYCPSPKRLHDSCALHLNGPVNEFPAAYQIVHLATLSVLVQLSSPYRNPITQEGQSGVPSGIVNARTISLTLVGFLIGVLAAGGIGVRVIEEVRAEDDATSLPSENVASTSVPLTNSFTDPHETLVASSAIVLSAIVTSDTSVGINYDIVSLAPTGGNATSELPFLYPRLWRLSTEAGTVEGGPVSVGQQTALFDVPKEVGVDDLELVEIIDPLMAYPLDRPFELSAGAPLIEIVDGVQVELVNISKQNDTDLVSIDLIAEDPLDLTFVVEGMGPGWESGQHRPGGAAVELLWVGGDLPAVLSLRAVGVQWVVIDGAYPVSLEGIR